MNKRNQSSKHTSYPPVVAVLGHVDHGKTSLLDAIRKTNAVREEEGGITQRIGASSVEVTADGVKRRITFIDTPGHEAFALMRKRGIAACDIGLLVVALDDGIKPQTKESIAHLASSKLPFIIVLTKDDLPSSNAQRVTAELVKEGVVVDRMGGTIPVIEISSKTGHHIKELLDLILLVWDMQESSSVQDTSCKGIIIESKLDPQKGSVATVVIKQGTLRVKDELYWIKGRCRVRGLIDSSGMPVDEAGKGEAIEVLGFKDPPSVGEIVGSDSSFVQKIPVKRAQSFGSEDAIKQMLFAKQEKGEKLSVILCADREGSLEAIDSALSPSVSFILVKTGEISEADVLLAKSSGSIIIGFNAGIRSNILALAKTEKVPIKNYTIIYELIDEIRDVIAGKELAIEEEILGVATVLARFPFEKTFALGVKVTDGRVARGDKVRLVRGDTHLGESVISSLRQGKANVSKVEKGKECGVLISPFLDFTIGDVLLSHN